MSSRGGPTIVLLGGQVTLDSGATVDSRQPIAGDEWDVVLRQALGKSEAWWQVAKGFVDIVLAQDQRPDAWALVWLDDKSLKRPRADGTYTRVRFKSFFEDPEYLISAGYTATGGGKLSSDAASSRYRVLPYLLRFDDMQGGSSPVVIVGGFHTTYDDGTDIVGDRPLDYFVSRWPQATIVLPHTPIIEAKALRVLKNPPSAPVQISGLAERTHSAESKRYAAALEHTNDLRRADSYVINHDFRVTFWADEGVVRDPADLDAALTFVKSRFDLNLGLWDLARDPVLRETLLTREGVVIPAKGPAPVPQELVKKASEKAEERKEAEAEELAGRRRHHAAIWPTLSSRGWDIPHWQREGVAYRLAAGPLVPSVYPDAPDEPALFFSLGITKRQAVLALHEPALTGRTKEFIRSKRDLIASITGLPPDDTKQVLWRIAGKGWAGSPEGWPKALQTIESVVAALSDDLEPIGKAAAKGRIEQLKSTHVGIEINISPQGSVTTKKTSMWDRLRGKKD